LGTFASTPDNPLGGALRAGGVIPYCVPFNITGQPAISVPMGQTDDGLPIGTQLVARYGADRLLLELSERLAEAIA
jgi:Asp-tRNA(Asn)/Glu-tRNA(Gln) amidotransferase A subunit family amidase